MHEHRQSILVTTLAIAFLIAGCGQKDADEAPAASQPEVDSGMPPREEPRSAVILRTPSPKGARVFFITPADGDTVKNPITVEFGIEGMEVVKAGDNTPDSGHHHLLVNAGLPNLDLPIPADENHIHFGDGSTSTELTLEPGDHTLQLLLGDHLHIPHVPPVVSESINIVVE